MPALGQYDAAPGSVLERQLAKSINSADSKKINPRTGLPYGNARSGFNAEYPSVAPDGPPAPPTPAGPSLADIQAKMQADAKAAADAALAKANAEGKSRSKKANDATRSLADQQFALFGSFDKARTTKLGNIAAALKDSDRILLGSYGTALKGLKGSADDNDKAATDASFVNLTNAARERGEVVGEAAALGAGESDLLRTQLTALRNYASNQSDVNRSFFDTLRSVNNSIGSLNSDTATSRGNLYNQAESDKESTWSNYYNQKADTWTQIGNIENSNTNVDSDSSVGYDKKYAQAGKQAAAAAAGSYKRQSQKGLDSWTGKGKAEDRTLNSNRAATVSLGPTKRPEGATLRKW
jgi:hypothetical protein